MAFGRSFVFVLCTLPAALACGATSNPDGSGGASASGGRDTGTGGASNLSGGAPGSGGAQASGGNTSSGGTAGSPGDSGWEELRCFQYEGLERRTCFGRVGNLWAGVDPPCEFEGEPKDPMNLNQELCGEADEAGEWGETWCGDDFCFGRLGEWTTSVEPECNLYPYPKMELEGTPSELYCDVEEAPDGWQDVQCILTEGDFHDVLCWGSRGVYYPALVPSCWIERHYTTGSQYVEVTPDSTYCP